MINEDVEILRPKREIFSDGERCSHCAKPIPFGGSRHGQGVYCRSCIRRHTKSGNLTGPWVSSRNCPHCVTAGVLPGFLPFVFDWEVA